MSPARKTASGSAEFTALRNDLASVLAKLESLAMVPDELRSLRDIILSALQKRSVTDSPVGA